MIGTDKVFPTDNYTTCDRHSTVKLRIPENGTKIEMYQPMSLPGLLKNVVNTYPDAIAYAFKDNDKGEWIKRTYREYLEEIKTVAKAFLHLGLERHKAVCILGRNSPEWLISDVAAIFAGGIACGIYTTNSIEACHYIAETSKANIIVVEDNEQLEKIQAVRHNLPHLKVIIQYTCEPEDPSVLSWKRVLEIGAEQNDEHLEKILKTITVNECSTLIYTSGTTGKPKGVMLSHDNLIWNVISLSSVLFGNQSRPFNNVCFLPFSHVAGQCEYIYAMPYNVATIYFADRDALKGSIMKTLREIQPTTISAVPRIFEKIYEEIIRVDSNIEEQLNKISDAKRSLLIAKIKESIGFSKCFKFICGAAPLAKHVKALLSKLDIQVSESFGMSELAGLHTTDHVGSFKVEAAGKELPGTKTKINNPVDGQGEIMVFGRHVFMGYLDDPEKTIEAIDSDGWLHTGDLGKIDEDGYVYITGRIKELIITAGGENVAPFPIEETIKSYLPAISNAFVVGDRKKYLTILFTLKCEIDSSGKPTDVLSFLVQRWLDSLGCPAGTVSEVLKNGLHPRLNQAIQEGIACYNKKAISNAQRLQKFVVLPVDFSDKTGEFGPTMKLKRDFVTIKYKNVIDALYA